MNVHILNDDVLEQTEAFRMYLTGTTDIDKRILLTQTEGIVIIINDDGKIIL